MVLTSSETSFCNRFTNLAIWLWGLIYLFFSTIFSDHKKLGNTGSGSSTGGSKMNGLGGKKQGPKMGGG